MFLTHAPRRPLSEFIDYLWLFEESEQPRKQRILPSGTIELVVNLNEHEIQVQKPESPDRYERFSTTAVSGAYSCPFFVYDATQHKSMFGVHFRPGGAFPFLGIQPSEIADTHANLGDLWGRLALDLRERLYSAATACERFGVAEQILLSRLLLSRGSHAAVVTALKILGPSGTGAPVRDVAREVGLSHRRFVELFTREVGIAPKLLCRILRFQRVRSLAEADPPSDWAQFASMYGYFDQSHLIKDFQEFSGLTPTEYVRLYYANDRPEFNHVPVAGLGGSNFSNTTLDS
jgi:AraC-like DNA-binding protein